MTQRQSHRKYPVARGATRSTVVYKERQGRKIPVMGEFGTYFQPVWEEIASDEDLGRTELRVLILCSALAGKDNIVPLLQVEMGARLGVSRQAIHRAMRMLVEKGFIFQQGHRYRLNSHLAAHAGLEGIMRLRREDAKVLKVLLQEERECAKREEV